MHRCYDEAMRIVTRRAWVYSVWLAASLLTVGVTGCDGEDGTDVGDAGDAGDGDGGDGDGGDGGDGDVPDIAYCDEVSAWDAGWADFETQVITLVNQERAKGANCGTEGSFAAAGPLTNDARLRCAARKHSLDMHERGYFDHTSPDGELPWDRMTKAGYNWSTAGENIAGGYGTPEAVVAGWMSSDGHCANIMAPGFEHIGVGYHGTGALWTQVFGAD